MQAVNAGADQPAQGCSAVERKEGDCQTSGIILRRRWFEGQNGGAMSGSVETQIAKMVHANDAQTV